VSFFEISYAVIAILLAVYGTNAFVMLALYVRHRRRPTVSDPLPSDDALPVVTVQLPIFNELYVVERLIDAVARLEYPRERLQIQVLDDSTDETTALAEERAAHWRTQGLDVQVIHRKVRTDYKAGALREGLKTARGEYIAIFDADFVPPSDFLLRTVPHFRHWPRLGFLQTRWAHFNGDYSFLTRAQTLALDGHFVVEQTARQRSGLFMNFNGTAGVWRRQCIADAGGWQGDTLSEDLDLSYRAQLRCWECLYLPEVAAPAEVPPQVNAFKRQQFRWAKGSIQCLQKLWRPLLAARQPWFKRLQGFIHISSYLAHPLMVLLLLITLPMLLGAWQVRLPLALLTPVSLGPPLLYAAAQAALYSNWPRRIAYLPLLVLLGTGIALNNTRAIVEALLGRQTAFLRTPKFRVAAQGDGWAGNAYALGLDPQILGEVLLGLYALVTVGVALVKGHFFAVPFLLLYAGGFGYVALVPFPSTTQPTGYPFPQRPAYHGKDGDVICAFHRSGL
jgi:cellulose synthase/poly-beta-1,6-N-acetylglucosamine synthase-like glycosyltransferase